MKRRTDKPIDATGRRRLDMLRAAPIEHSLTDVVLTMLAGQDPRDRPHDERVAVLDGRLVEAQELPNLDALILDRAAGLLIA
jgi:hypothetical protein